MLMYNPSLPSITHSEPLLIHMSNRFSISSNESFKLYLWFITVFTCELKWSVVGSNSLSLIHFFRVILTLIIYLKPLFSLNNSSNKFFMLFLLTDNESLKYLLLIISIL